MRPPVSLGLLALAACATADLAAPDPSASNPSGPLFTAVAGAARLTAYTQNVYVGTNVDLVLPALLSSDPSDDLPALLAAAAVLAETDFTARAAAIAAEVERTRPHVVGLYEVSSIDVDLTPLGLPVVVHEDFLPEIQAALQARGLHYAVAGAVQGLTAAPPLPLGATVDIVDRDVLLVDADRVTVSGPVLAQNYTANVGPIATGVLLVRSFVLAPVTIDGHSYTVVATHPESELAGFPSLSGLRALQIGELLSYVPSGSPAIVMGDLNDLPGSPMYQLLAGAGFEDVWASLRPQSDGFTCCNADDLANPFPTYDQRIDYVFARGLDGPAGSLTGRVDRYGDTPADRFDGPTHSLWPSDHAGLVAALVVPAAMAR